MTASPHLARFAPAVAAGIVLLAIPTAWAVADTDVSSSTTSGERVLRLNWTLTEARDGEVAPEGLSSGDTFQAAFLLAGRSTGSADTRAPRQHPLAVQRHPPAFRRRHLRRHGTD